MVDVAPVDGVAAGSPAGHAEPRNAVQASGERPGSQKSKLRFFSASKISSTLRLRGVVTINPATRLVIGLNKDLHPEEGVREPFLELIYDFKRDGQKTASFRLNTQRATIEREFKLKFKQLSARLDLAAGLSLETGDPIYGVSLHEVKPWPVVVGAAVLLLAAGKTLSVNEKIGRFLINLPPLYTTSQWQCKVSVDRTRSDGIVQLHMLNPVISIQ